MKSGYVLSLVYGVDESISNTLHFYGSMDGCLNRLQEEVSNYSSNWGGNFVWVEKVVAEDLIRLTLHRVSGGIVVRDSEFLGMAVVERIPQ